MTLTSSPRFISSPLSLRKYSRHHLFRRFLITELPTLPLIVIPNLKCSPEFFPKLIISHFVGEYLLPARFRFSKSDLRRRILSFKLFATNGNSQSFSAFSATSAKNLTSVFGFHTSAKPVGLLTSFVTWLICALHLYSSFRIFSQLFSAYDFLRLYITGRKNWPRFRRQ